MGGIGVSVGGIGVAVSGIGVSVGGIFVGVSGIGVSVGGIGVAEGIVDVPHALQSIEITAKRFTNDNILVFIFPSFPGRVHELTNKYTARKTLPLNWIEYIKTCYIAINRIIQNTNLSPASIKIIQ